MIRLAWGEIAPSGELPGFGTEFVRHMRSKRNPHLYSASLSAWKLLEGLLAELDLPLPEVAFSESGKPYFSDFSLFIPDSGLQDSNFSLKHTAFPSNFSLFFSISHSENLAAAVISDLPCGIDVEMVRPALPQKLYARCMHPAEVSAGLDFFEAWTRKECIAKLTGAGLPGRPNTINTLEYDGWHTEKIVDSRGQTYILNAIAKREPED